jgi:hypothetical protein
MPLTPAHKSSQAVFGDTLLGTSARPVAKLAAIG